MISEDVLSLFAGGSRKPSKNLLDRLGYEAVVAYRRKKTNRSDLASRHAATGEDKE